MGLLVKDQQVGLSLMVESENWLTKGIDEDLHALTNIHRWIGPDEKLIPLKRESFHAMLEVLTTETGRAALTCMQQIAQGKSVDRKLSPDIKELSQRLLGKFHPESTKQT